MKFSIPSKSLLSQLSLVSKVVNSKNSISILDNFLFELVGEQLVITGSDSETTLSTRVAVVDSEGEGKIAVNVKKLLDLLKELPDQPLLFEIEDSTYEIVITYQNGQYNFVGIDGNEFPQRSSMDVAAKTYSISVKEILAGIDHTLFASGADELHPIMMSVYWNISPENVVFVATDTHKLVRYTNNRIQTGVEDSFILPTKPANILKSVLGKEEGEVTVTTDAKGAVFESSSFTLSCRFVNGRYPNYNSVIPQNNPFKLVVDRVSLLNAIRRVSVFANASGLVMFQLKENEIYMKAEDREFSTMAEERMSCDYQGEEMLIGFNNSRMLDVLNNISADTVTVNLSGPARAGVFLPDVQEEGEEMLVLLMPMMVS